MPRQLTDEELDALVMGGQARPAAPAQGLSDDALDGLILGRPAAPAPATSAPATAARKKTSTTSALPFDPSVTTLYDPASTKPDAALSPEAAVGRAIIDGVPIIGPYLTAGTDRLIAAGRTGRIGGGPEFDHELSRVRAQGKKTTEEHPYATLGGNMLGAVASMGPVAGAFPSAFGLTGAIGKRMLAGGVSNMLVGGADAGVRGGVDAIPMGLASGAAGGVAGPVIGEYIGGPVASALGKAAGWVGNKLTGLNPNVAAKETALDLFGKSGNSLTDVAAELRANPRLAPMDVDSNMRLYAQGIMAQPGEGRAILERAVGGRMDGAKAAVREAADEAGGAMPNVDEALKRFKATIQENGKRNFTEALRGAKPVNLAGMSDADIQAVDGAWRKAVQNFPDPKNPGLTQPEMLHLAQSRLREEADALLKSSSGADKIAGRDLHGVRQRLVDRIDEATGGKFRPAQAAYADDSAIEEAFNRGVDIFSGAKGSKALAAHPDVFRAQVATMKPAEQAALALGARVRADQQMGTVRSAGRGGREIADADYNLENLKTVWGDQKALDYAKRLQQEQNIAYTNNKIREGAKTAETNAAKDATSLPVVGPWLQGAPLTAGAAILGGIGSAVTGSPYGAALGGAAMLYGGLRKGAQVYGRDFAGRRNAELARIASATGADKATIMNALANRATPAPSWAPFGDRYTNMLMSAAGDTEGPRNMLTEPMVAAMRRRASR